MKKMVVLIGIPAAGKTTIARELFSSHECVSLDRLPNRTRNAEDKLLIELCSTGRDIIVDGANIDKLKRMRYLRFAKEYGYDAVALMVDSSLDAALARNEQRDRKVPEGAIKSYCEKLEYPDVEEGFSQVFIMWNNWDPRQK